MIGRNNSPVNNEAQKPFNVTEWRESFILAILRIGCLLGIALIGVSFPNATPSDRILFVGLYLGLLAITLLRVPYSVRAYALLLISFIIGANAILAWGPWVDGSVFLLASVVVGALLFDRRVDAVVFVISIILMTTVAILQSLGVYQLRAEAAPQTIPINWLGYIFDFAVIGAVIVAAMNQFKNAFSRIIQETQTALSSVAIERERLEEKVVERTEVLESRMSQLRSATTAARLVAEIQDIHELLETSTKLITEKFGYYHVGLFILDEYKKNAYLQSSSSARGKDLIGQAFNLESNRKNPLAVTVEQNRSVITLDIDSKNFVPDDNFPLTRSRMILPLAIRSDVIGVLDLHSDQPRAFNVEDAEILQALTDLIAIAFDNVRLINETQNLVSQLEANTSIQTQRTWRKLTSRQMPAYQYTPAGVRPIFNREKRSGGDVDNKNSLLVPLVLSGQTIGNIKLKRKSNSPDWTEREKSVVEKIADQVSLALENSRLVEEAQKSAVRDQMIANISTRIRETLDIESVARTAATELQRVFDLKEAEVVIGSQFEKQDGKS
ncbi:MAG: GAF domain-containing protein [Anaerolineales bacterium]|nr:GAF domain-containing protein [Anaerolineales bacterium]